MSDKTGNRITEVLDYTGLTVLTFFLFLPGQIELHLILSPTKSAAIPRLRPMTAAFVDPYTHRLGAPCNIVNTG